MKRKTNRIQLRLDDSKKRKLDAICRINGKNRTSVIENLIEFEYQKDKKYEDAYFNILNKERENR